MQVTDVKRIINKGKPGEKEVTGYYMDRYLKENLDGIPNFLKKNWDVVGIISGQGLVGVGKSTFAAQIGYYIAWMLAGGRVIADKDGNTIKIIPPTRELTFNLKENLVFSAEDLQDRAKELHDKYGKGQVIIYDEGRQGLDSKRAMESVNKGMEDFFQECRFYGHVFLIVLPNFFKLHEDYAVARSIFLCNCFVDKKLNRGYFHFFNHRQKENLYYFGKKKIGVTAKYNSASPSFWGRFTKWSPFDTKEYDAAKKKALEKKRQSRTDKKVRVQRNALLYLLNKTKKMKVEEISDRLQEMTGVNLTKQTIHDIISKINQTKIRDTPLIS